MGASPTLTFEIATDYLWVFKRQDGYYFYDPASWDDGPYPTAEIAEAALEYYMEYYF